MTDQVQYDEMCERVVKFISDNLLAEGVHLDADSSLTQLGLDSFSLIEMLLFVERQYGVVVPMQKFNRENTETVRAFAEVVLSEINSQ